MPANKLKRHRITVYSSVQPITSLVSYLGDFIDAQTIIPAWANPHDYEPKPRDIKRISKADLYVVVGLNFEPKWVLNTVSTAHKPVIILSDILKDLDYSNPHIWLSLKNAIRILKILKDTLTPFLPPKLRNTLEENFQNTVHRIDNLDSLYSQKFQSLNTRKFASLHRAWTYLARDYNLNEVASLQLEHERTPGPKELKKFIDSVKSNGVRVILADRFVPTRFINLIRRETHCKVLMLDPIGSNGIQSGYIKLMRENLEKLYQALKGEHGRYE